VDGVEKSSLAASGVINTTSDPLVIGAADQSGNAATTFNGAIDGVRLFSRGLTPEEVVELYNAPTIDLTPPDVMATQFVYQTAPNAISVTFSENVSGLDASSLTVTNLTTGAAYPASTYNFNTTTHVATFGFASIPPAGNPGKGQIYQMLPLYDVENAEAEPVAFLTSLSFRMGTYLTETPQP